MTDIHSTFDEMQARLVTGDVEIELPYEVLLLQCFEFPTRLRFGRSLQKSGFVDSGNDGCERRDDDHVQYRISPSLSFVPSNGNIPQKYVDRFNNNYLLEFHNSD